MNARAAWPVLFVVLACEKITPVGPPVGPPTGGTLDQQLRAAIGQWGTVPIGPMPAENPQLVELGQALFFDKILSGNRDISCANCHEPALTVGDGTALPVGTGGSGVAPDRTLGSGRAFVPRNSPTLLNIALGQNYIFWDGRVQRMGPNQFNTPAGAQLPAGLPNVLAAQAMFPVTNRVEMRGKPGDRDVFGNANELADLRDDQFAEIWYAITQRLMAIPEYVTLFRAAFPTTPVQSFQFSHAATAIAAFERSAMIRALSPFDRYLTREDAALTTEQKRGGILFFGEARCSSCHNGPFLGGNGFANVGVPQLGPGTGAAAPLDKGFGETFQSPFYDFAFRVAPLRNVELTAPYMHNGAYATLEAVLTHYSDVPKAIQQYDVTQLPVPLRATHHGDAATVAAVLATVDHRVPQPGSLTDADRTDLLAFLRALTDPAARDLLALAPARVPSGLPIH